jgi:hypothetical protein
MRGSMPGERRGGRQAGTPNKIPNAVREMILEALDGAGGVEYLRQQAKDNPGAFLTLIGKVLPKDIRADVQLGDNLAFEVLIEK